MKNWKRRYFVLDENSLNYYKTDMVRKRRRAQTRWHQCSKTHHVAPKHWRRREWKKSVLVAKLAACLHMQRHASWIPPHVIYVWTDYGLSVHIYGHTPCVCVRTYVCVWLSVHTFLCVIMSWVQLLQRVCSSTESWRRKVCFRRWRSESWSWSQWSVSHIHAGSVSTLEVFGSLINPVKRTPECFCKVRRVIHLPLFVKSSWSSLTSMFTHRLPCVHADICLHAIIQTDTIKHLDHAYHQHTRVFMDADPNDTRENYLTVK